MDRVDDGHDLALRGIAGRVGPGAHARFGGTGDGWIGPYREDAGYIGDRDRRRAHDAGRAANGRWFMDGVHADALLADRLRDVAPSSPALRRTSWPGPYPGWQAGDRRRPPGKRGMNCSQYATALV